MSEPSFLIDECLPFDVTLVVRQRGLDAADIVELGLRGLNDLGVWDLGAKEKRILMTRDKDFPLRDVLPRPPGLVLIRAPDVSTAQGLGLLVAALLDTITPASLVGRITVVGSGRYRQRAW